METFMKDPEVALRIRAVAAVKLAALLHVRAGHCGLYEDTAKAAPSGRMLAKNLQCHSSTTALH